MKKSLFLILAIVIIAALVTLFINVSDAQGTTNVIQCTTTTTEEETTTTTTEKETTTTTEEETTTTTEEETTTTEPVTTTSDDLTTVTMINSGYGPPPTSSLPYIGLGIFGVVLLGGVAMAARKK